MSEEQMSPSGSIDVQTAVCTKCTQSFPVHLDELAFLDKLTFHFGETAIKLPEPTLCPDCRCQLRTAHRNERNLYKVPSAFSGKDVISIYDANPLWGEPYTIYSQEEWNSDAWDPLSFGQEVDLTQPIFPQWSALIKTVPRMALASLGNENSGFTTGTGYCRNCYLINSSEQCEDCYYSKLLQNCKSSCDCSYAYDSELCYECCSVSHCYHCQWVSFSQNCTDCFFSSNLSSCKNCCLCTNLDHKEYHFMNQPLSKEEYEKRMAEWMGSWERTQQMKALYDKVRGDMVCKYGAIVNCQECTGDYIEESKGCHDCYDVTKSEDCRYVHVGIEVKDCYDCSNMYLKPELCYHTLGTIEAHTCAYCTYLFYSQRMLYCDYCFHCSDCFGCSGLTRKQYCIFNKQYTEEEYNTLVPKIIAHMQQTGEWGQFLPAQYSPFAYNESLANEYFPLSREEAVAQGFHWRESDPKQYLPATGVLLDHIREVTDDSTQQIYCCSDCQKNYRIIPQELSFYRDQQIAAPRQCWECRYNQRLVLRNPRKLWDRQCGTCSKALKSTFAPENPTKILCEECYLKEVY